MQTVPDFNDDKIIQMPNCAGSCWNWPDAKIIQMPNDDKIIHDDNIIQMPNGTFHCTLCWKNPDSMWQVNNHVRSKEHQRRLTNLKYEQDPLADVPYPHREFTEVRNGWATCKICDCAMVENHWKSRAHVKWLVHELQQQRRADVNDKMTCIICNGTMNEGHLESDRHLQYVDFYRQNHEPVPQRPLPQPPPPSQPPPPPGPPPSHPVRGRNSDDTMQSPTSFTNPWETTPSPDPWATGDHNHLQQQPSVPGLGLPQPSSPPQQINGDSLPTTGATGTSSCHGHEVQNDKSRHSTEPPAPLQGPQKPCKDGSESISSNETYYSTVQAAPCKSQLASTHPQQLEQRVAVPASDDAADVDPPRYSYAIAIHPYNPQREETETGYLEVKEGTVIRVLSGSRETAAKNNRYRCNYVFAWPIGVETVPDKGGWLPVNILGHVPACSELQ